MSARELKGHVRMLRAERRCKLRNHGECGRDCRERDMPGQPMLCGPDFLAHSPRIAHDPAGPFEDALTFRRQTQESRAAPDQHNAELLFELLDGRRERRLGDVALLGRAAKMLLFGQSNEHFQLLDHERVRIGHAARNKFGSRSATDFRVQA
jgi:hypothetical protein